VTFESQKDQFIDWGSRETHLLFNPKIPETLKLGLSKMLMPHLPEHIWIGSSGASGDSGSAKSGGPSLKFFALSKSSFLISSEAVNSHIQASKKDIWLNVLPIFHVGGLSIFSRAFLSHSKVVDRSGSDWGASQFHAWVEDSHATLTSLVPTQIYDLVKLGKSAPRSLRVIFVGGARLEEDLYLKARDLGFPILPSYGMTECCSQIATASPIMKIPQLELLPHIEAKTVEDGILAIKSPSLFRAQAVWRGDGPTTPIEILWRVGEWFRTQDKAEIVIDSKSNIVGVKKYLIPLGRLGDEIKISGELVSITELSKTMKLLVGHENENNFCLLSEIDSRRGAEVIAVFSIDKQNNLFNLTADWIKKFNSQVLPVAKIRKAYFVPELPRSDLGKIKLGELKSILRL
jgi:O-succinylbenzoic acid--CoA ligase